MLELGKKVERLDIASIIFQVVLTVLKLTVFPQLWWGIVLAPSIIVLVFYAYVGYRTLDLERSILKRQKAFDEYEKRRKAARTEEQIFEDEERHKIIVERYKKKQQEQEDLL